MVQTQAFFLNLAFFTLWILYMWPQIVWFGPIDDGTNIISFANICVGGMGPRLKYPVEFRDVCEQSLRGVARSGPPLCAPLFWSLCGSWTRPVFFWWEASVLTCDLSQAKVTDQPCSDDARPAPYRARPLYADDTFHPRNRSVRF